MAEAPLRALAPARPPWVAGQRGAVLGAAMFFRAAVLPLLVGLVGAAVSFVGSWIPSPWGDEAASVMSAERPWGSLARMLTTVDAVHGTYYAFLHIWIPLVGSSMGALRLPSSLAVGVAAAGVVVLVRGSSAGQDSRGASPRTPPSSAARPRLRGAGAALVAGLVFLLLPRTTSMGIEARSYALSAAAAVWLVVLVVALLRRPSAPRRWWLAYALVLAVSAYVFLYTLLLLPAFAILVLLSRPSAALLRRWAGFTVLGVVLAGPVIAFAIGQRDQISFLGQQNAVTAQTVLVTQWFGSVAVAAFCWVAVLVTVVGAVRRVLRRPAAAAEPAAVGADAAAVGADAAASGAAVADAEPRVSMAMVGAVTAFIPLLVLLASNAAGHPIYTVRYLSFATPFVAVLVALGVGEAARLAAGLAARLAAPLLPANRDPDSEPRAAVVRSPDPGSKRSPAAAATLWGAVVTVVVVAALAALVAPVYVEQRTPHAKDGGSDWAEVASTVGAHAHPGDAVVFDELAPNSRLPREVKYLYPADFRGLVDVTLRIPRADTPGLRDVTRSIADSADALRVTDGRVWFVDYRGGSAGPPPQLAELAAQGYRVTETFRLHRDTVYRLDR